MWPLPLLFVLPRDWETLDFFLSVPFVLFSLWVRSFSGLGGRGRRGGSCWNRAVEYSLIPAHPPRTRAGPGLGVAVGFLHPQRSSWRSLTTQPKSSRRCPQPGSASGIRLERARGRAQPGTLALALPGAAPTGEPRAQGGALAALPWPQPRGLFLLLSFRVPTSLSGCTKVVLPAGPGPGPPRPRCWKGLAQRCCSSARS